MAADDLAFTPAWQLRDQLRARQVSSVELTELYLRRIERLNPELRAYLTVSADLALAQARAADEALAAGRWLGPLHGLPIGIKDLNATKGVRTTRGSLIFKDWVPDEDDILVERVRAAGAVFLGKTNTPEFGCRATTENLLGPPCRNPWDPARTSGGSSGGSAAAVAAGLCAVATGSDAGGSIRMPSSFCGVYGLKPAQGRVPGSYMGPGGWRVFSQGGPIARTVRDACLLLDVLAGPDSRDALAIQDPPPGFEAACRSDVRGLRIAWSADWGYAPVDPEVRRITERAAKSFADLGATVEEADLRLDGEAVKQTFYTIFAVDYIVGLAPLVPKHRDVLDPLLLGWLDEAATWPATRLALALHELEWHRHRMMRLFDRYDLLLTPTMATPPFPLGQRLDVIDGQATDPDWGFTPFCYPINMVGLPAASVPCDFTANGLPVGLHVIGRKNDEVTVIRASAAFEEAHPWAHLRPSAA